jgi:AbiV family abortive infection protein
MEETSAPQNAATSTPFYVEQRRHCLEHARDLIASAERVLADDNGFQNIAYHLAILALEEIGKAGMLTTRAITKDSFDVGWIDKRLDNHVQKLMWAVWSPSVSGGRIDPRDFEEARRFAESTHERRMAGLYVNYSEKGPSAPPRQAVRLDHATSVLGLAKARLEVETATGTSNPSESSEELEWFLTTVADEFGKNRLFSQPFAQKHEEFGGDTRAWVRWARTEFGRIAEEERQHLQRELSRQASEPGNGKPKWLMKVRVQTRSHSLRQKTLNFWNDRVQAVKLRTAGPKNNDLLLEMTINDHIKVEHLFDFGLSISKLHLAMLNIGTAGLFWYELSGQEQTYYESIQELDAPHMQIFIGREAGLAKQWSEDLPGGGKRQRVALENEHLNTAIMGLAVYGPWSDKEAEPIFGQYLHGLMLLSKNDLHLPVANQARDSFLNALRKAMHRFGNLEREDADLLPALHQALQPIISEEAHRTQLFKTLDGTATEGSLTDAVSAKRVTDLYLALMARRLWPEFVKRHSTRPANMANKQPDA